MWIVDGGSVGLPTEFAERVMIALLHISSQNNFQSRKVYFTVYRILKTLGLTINNRNYKQVEDALDRLVAVTVFNDNAWYDKNKKKRIKTKNRFHIIDRVFMRSEDDEENEESFIIWGDRIWESVQAGYLKYIDLDFYYSLQLPLSRRLYRFLDKMMAYQDSYQIDIHALQNKLGMAPVGYPSRLKRPIQKAANELIERGWLGEIEFFRVGNYTRVRFSKHTSVPVQMNLIDEPNTERTITLSPEQEWWEEFMVYATAANKPAESLLKKLTLVSRDGGVYVFESSQTDKRFVDNVTAVLTRTLRARGELVERVEVRGQEG